MNHETHNGRSIADILVDTREELKEFLGTRISLLRAELREKARVLKTSAPLALIGLLLLSTAYLLFTGALVGLVLAFLSGNPFRWAIALAAVGLLWTVGGGLAAYMALRRLRTCEFAPKRTIGVLKQDGLWIQSEVRSRG